MVKHRHLVSITLDDIILTGFDEPQFAMQFFTLSLNLQRTAITMVFNDSGSLTVISVALVNIVVIESFLGQSSSEFYIPTFQHSHFCFLIHYFTS